MQKLIISTIWTAIVEASLASHGIKCDFEDNALKPTQASGIFANKMADLAKKEKGIGIMCAINNKEIVIVAIGGEGTAKVLYRNESDITDPSTCDEKYLKNFGLTILCNLFADMDPEWENLE